MSNRTVIYARVSTEDQVEKYGLPVQLRLCREYSALHGLQVIAECTDEGISGVIEHRPGIEQVLAMVRAHRADIVLVVDSDRLSRELELLLRLKRLIEEHARLECVASKFEDSINGKLFFQIRGAIAEHERGLIRQRTMRGQRERASAGLLVGGRTPFGYRCEAGVLTPDPERALVIRSIFEWYRSGESIRAIAQKLCQAGTPSWGGKPWGHTSVRWILGSETYAGLAKWGTRRREKDRLAPQPISEWKTFAVPALIDRGEWDQVQAMLAENAVGRRGARSRHFLLSGLLQCSCGRKMYGEFNRRRKYQVYRCGGRDRENGCACRRTANGSRLDAAVWREIVGTFGDPSVLRAALRAAQAPLCQAPPDRSEHLRGQAARMLRREEAALKLLLDPDFAADRAKVKAQYKDVQAQRVAAEAELARIAAASRPVELGDWVEETTELLREFFQGVTDVEDRQKAARQIVRKVEWNGSEALVHCFFSGGMSNMSRRSDLHA